MITMEMDMLSALSNNEDDCVFYSATGQTRKTRSFLHGFERQLSGMARTVELIFERGMNPCHGTLSDKMEGIQFVCREIFAVRLTSFYTALVGLLECFNPDGNLNARSFPVGDNKIKRDFELTTSKADDGCVVTTSLECFSSDFNNNSSELKHKENPVSDAESKSLNRLESSTSSLAATSPKEVSTNRVERPRTLFVDNVSRWSNSQEFVDKIIHKAASGEHKNSSQNRKSNRRFVTTAVTGAEIAAAYHTLAAATFRLSDLNRPEKTRHSSFVSRGTSTPRRRNDILSWLAQSLPSLPPHFEVTSDHLSQLLAASKPQAETAQQRRQQQTQTTLSTRDVSTSSDLIPMTDKAVQIRHGEILEPVDRPPSRIDRHRKRQGIRCQLQKIIEEPEEYLEEDLTKMESTLSPFSPLPLSSSSSYSSSRFEHRLYGCSRDAFVSICDKTTSVGQHVSRSSNLERIRPGTPSLDRGRDAPQPKTINYFFTSKQ